MIERARIKSASFDAELHWLVNKMVKPELAPLVEALHICSNLLLYNSPQHPDAARNIERGPAITLPISAAKDELSGILVRDGAYIVKMNVAMKERHFNRVLSRLHLCKPFLLPQILTAKRSIDNAVALLVRASSVFDGSGCDAEKGADATDDGYSSETTHGYSSETTHGYSSETTHGFASETKHGLTPETKHSFTPETNHASTNHASTNHASTDKSHGAEDCGTSHHRLMALFTELLGELQTAKNSLQLPTQPELVFPAHVTRPDFFDPELSPHMAVDLYISQAEVCIDLKDLARVTERPWCDIGATGKSYVDTLRDRMSGGEAEPEHSRESVLGSVLQTLSLRPRYEPSDYIARCVTYNGMVVMVQKKIEVSSADPVLVSAFTKLDSVEHMVGGFLENIRKLYEGGRRGKEAEQKT